VPKDNPDDPPRHVTPLPKKSADTTNSHAQKSFRTVGLCG
jgi:hypothetical protein